ncbi:MAG: hypothetical protein ABSA85_00120 [Terracidiphilus sp.]|jgi:hypothetical protein
MLSFRRLALLLAFALPAMPAAFAQSSGDSSSSATPDQSQSSSQASPGQPSAGQTQGQLTVQARIRQRREQRRATAIHDAYDHKWESYADMGYLRFTPGPSAQRLTFYAWETGLTQFRSERLGYTLVGRGYIGNAYVGLNFTNNTRPQVSMYNLLFGPTYRFYLQPKYSVSGRVMGGWAYGNFEGDTNGEKNLCNVVPGNTGCLLYPSGSSFGASASIIGEYNLSPSVAFKLAPEYFLTGFGSTLQASRGFTAGIVYRFGKQ